jgi:hypothetical protein
VLERSQDTSESVQNTPYRNAKGVPPLNRELVDDTLNERDTLIMPGRMLPEKT